MRIFFKIVAPSIVVFMCLAIGGIYHWFNLGHVQSQLYEANVHYETAATHAYTLRELNWTRSLAISEYRTSSVPIQYLRNIQTLTRAETLSATKGLSNSLEKLSKENSHNPVWRNSLNEFRKLYKVRFNLFDELIRAIETEDKQLEATILIRFSITNKIFKASLKDLNVSVSKILELSRQGLERGRKRSLLELFVVAGFTLFFVVCLNAYQAKTIAAPLDDLTVLVKNYSKGGTAKAIPITRYNEIEILSDAFSDMIRSVDAARISLEDKIAQKSKIEKELRDENAKRQELVEIVSRSPTVVFLRQASEGWPVQFVSKNVNLLGYTPEDFYSGAVSFSDIVHPDDCERVSNEVENYSADPDRKDFEQSYRIRTPAGDVKWLDDWTAIRRNPEDGIITHYQGVVVDVTDRKLAEEKIHSEKNKAQRYLDIAGTVIVALDTSAQVTMINRLGCEILGRDEKDIVGRDWFDLVMPHENRNSERSLFEEIVADKYEGINRHENEVQSTEGELRIIAWHNTVLKDDENIIGVLSSGIDVTEARHARKAVLEREARYRSMTETAHDPIITIDEHGIIGQWNQAAESVFGYAAGEMIGGKLDRIILSRDLGRHKAGLKRLCNGGDFRLDGRITEVNAKCKDGSKVRIELALSRWKQAGKTNYTGILRDVTERRATEEQLRNLSQIVEQSQAAIVITDVEGGIEYVNPYFSELMKFDKEDVVGRKADTILPRNTKLAEEKNISAFKGLFEHLSESREWKGRIETQRNDGTTFLAGVEMAPLSDPNGDVTHFATFIHDISRQVEDEMHLKQAEKMEAIGGLAAGIAHDLNNMLFPVITLSRRVKNGLDEGSRNFERMSKVIEAGDRAKNLVSGILAFSRQEEAKLKPVNISQVILDALTLIKPTLPTTVNVIDDFDADTGIVSADASQLSSVLMNLASNSVDAMEGRPGDITIILTKTYIGADRSLAIANLKIGDYAKLEFIDPGRGMSASIVQRIMDPFFTTKGVGKGTGLGLSMVHGIITKHDGALTIKSAPMQGTTITIYLPLADKISRSSAKI